MNRIIIPITLTSLLLASCSGSESYKGKWFAMDAQGNEQEIYFTEEKMTLQRSENDSSVWTYTQHSISIENGASKYGIRADNGLTYSIVFPSKDKEKGALADANGNILYIIGRSKYYTYEDVFGLK